MSAAPTRTARAWRDRYGPWAVVTGASDGIGREMARHLAARGLNLVLVARRRPVLDALAQDLCTRHGIRVTVHDLDLGIPASWTALDAATATVDVGLLVAAAGFGTSGPLVKANRAVELDMVQVNCAATLALTQAFAERFVRRGRGGIVLMSSLLAFQGVARAANYAATKAYVQTLAEGLRAELAPHGVDVLACAPGPVRSGFAARAGMRMGMALPVEVVPGTTLDALGHRGTVRPGWLSWLLELSFLGQPRALRGWILGRIMDGMTRHAATADPGPAMDMEARR